MKNKFNSFILSGFCGLIIFSSCAKNSSDKVAGITIPAMRPPVAQVAGAGLTQTSFSTLALDPTNFRSRFFGAGPTNILNILSSLDSRLSGIASRTASPLTGCLTNSPTQMNITVFGETITMQFQCYEVLGTNNIIVFGKKDTIWYIFEKVGATVTTAIAEELSDGKMSVELYGTVGLSNPTDWSSMSYGGYHLRANTQTNKFEFTVGGLGFGFCGAYLNSDGTNIYIHGSEDGVGQACQATANICVLNANLGTVGNCAALGTGTFNLIPLGRAATTNFQAVPVNVSQYPAVPQLVLNGTGTDSVHYGPTVPADLAVSITAF